MTKKVLKLTIYRITIAVSGSQFFTPKTEFTEVCIVMHTTVCLSYDVEDIFVNNRENWHWIWVVFVTRQDCRGCFDWEIEFPFHVKRVESILKEKKKWNKVEQIFDIEHTWVSLGWIRFCWAQSVYGILMHSVNSVDFVGFNKYWKDQKKSRNSGNS